MRASVLYGPGDVRYEHVEDPKILKPTDAIIKLSATCICGSDLWPYRGLQPMNGPAHMGHEYCGVVVEVGTLACVVEHMSDGYHYVILDYVARPIGGALAHASDVTAAKFVDEGELATLALTNGLAELIARARATHAPWFTSR